MARISGKKLQFEQDEQEQLQKMEERAFELVNKHLVGRLREIEALGYNRTELAFAYFLLAYHAVRHGRSKEQAERSCQIMARLAAGRMERNFSERRKKLN